MKKLLLVVSILLTGAFTTFSFNDFATIHKDSFAIEAVNSDEIIVAFEKISSKQYAELDQALSQLAGIRKIGFCEKMNVFYFSYDNAIYRNADEAFDALILKTKIYQPLLKIGATSTDVQRECEK